MIANTFRASLLSQKRIQFFLGIAKISTAPLNEVIIRDIGDKGVIILNRPKQLNILSKPMIANIYFTLKEWKKRKQLVLIKGADEKAFCAGGDLNMAYTGDSNLDVIEYFKFQYSTDALINSYNIPYISIVDGIVMGSGVGLSIHGRYRVATERTLFAMPETKIGYFPDAGTSHFLPRLSGRLGWFLGLTGYRLKGTDTVKTGIATHYCKSENLKDLEDSLLNCSNESEIKTALDKYHMENCTEFSLTPYLEKINYCFSAETIEGILSRLEEDGSQWAKNTLNTLRKMSPTSLKITMKLLDLGKKLTLPECLQIEYRLAYNLVNYGTDVYIGTKALVEKNRNPKWNPPTLSDVSENFVDKYFAKIPQELDLSDL
ncbi:hypothetical protein NQ318_017400 [Aromia moschata]|uniref:3-hydroxyisobutyryl-CoA hydrolase, mitochondrial n=1 Tax=Aromia moschata TaxID=1265417 RepID=A0AAV8Z3L9_9CUCU|nr:hypothetical protein NQ318_017400 [Aromia moschata]